MELSRCARFANKRPDGEVTYRLNRLQAPRPTGDDYIVTLNPDERIAPNGCLREMSYDASRSTPTDSVDAQCAPTDAVERRPDRLLPALYHGWGFHEDGCVSGDRAAWRCGVPW